MLSKGYFWGRKGFGQYPEDNWREDSRIVAFRPLVRKRIAEILASDPNCQWRQQGCDFVKVLENQLFMEAASKEEYINLDTLRHRLKILIHRSATYIAMPTMGLTYDCNSYAADPPFNHFNVNSSELNPLVAYKTDEFRFLNGLPNNECEPRVASMDIALPVTRQVAHNKVLSPEMGSTVTTCSNGDGFPEFSAFDSGTVISQGHYPYTFEASFKDDFQQQYSNHGKLNLVKFMGNDQNLHATSFPSTLRESSEFASSISHVPEHIPGMSSELSAIFPGMDFGSFENLLQSKSQMVEHNQQQPGQTHWQFNKSMEIQTRDYFSEQNDFCSSVVGQTVPLQSQLPLQHYHGIHVASDSSVPFFSSKGSARLENSNNPLQFSMVQNILQAYMNYKSLVEPMGGNLVSFISLVHSKLCNKSCLCEHYHALLSHFDDGKLNHDHVNAGLEENFTGTYSDGYDSSCLENMSPRKRLKMENHFCPISSENGIASGLAPLFIQSCHAEGLPPLLQLPESPVSINSLPVQVNRELPDPVKSPVHIYQIRSNGADKHSRFNFESICTPSEEHIIGCKSDELCSRRIGEIADISKNDCNQLRFSSMPVPSEEHGAGFKQEVIQVSSMSEVEMPEIEKELNAPEVQHKEEMKPKVPDIRGVSLIEFFTAEQIKEHLSSLQQWTGQCISKEEKGNKIVNNTSENTCQLCATDKLLLDPVPIYCSCCSVRIKHGVFYYSTSEENSMHPCFCTSCYRVSRGGRITFYGTAIPKAELVKKKNDEATEEPWVECDKCKQWQHQICALFNDKRDMEGKAEYICPKCCLDDIQSRKLMTLSKTAIFAAKDLPTTMLSDYIEQRLFRLLQQERQERAKVVGMSPHEVPGAEDLVVRVVLSVNKQLKVKKQFLEIFHGENYPAEFQYKSKMILLFQKIGGVDICLFGFYVQEYGTDCSYPNQRCVYISYLDSVKYFKPQTETAVGEALRTFVYHEILIGYLEYCKKQGFANCYLWACPPQKGEDYILYCHPDIQQTPKSDKLRQWYHSMLQKAAKENIVVNFTNLYDQFFVTTGQYYSKVTAAHLPYFDGCYWSDAAEKLIEDIEKQSGQCSGRKVTMTKRTLKAMGHTSPSCGPTKDIQLMQKLGQKIFSSKEDFIIVNLQFVCTHCHKVILSGQRWFCSQCKNFQLCERCHDTERSVNGGDTHTINNKEKHLLSKVMVDDVPTNTADEDAVLCNQLFENRHSFLGFCQKNHYQFDTLRRAKHSTMMILHHLHNPTISASETTCRICHLNINTKDRDVCAACCHKKDGSLRIHKFRQCSSEASYGTESENAKQESLWQKELLDVLEHASQCPANNIDSCSYPKCLLIKRLFCHASKCTVRFQGGCLYCKKVWYVLALHSRNCRQTDCSIPRCKDLKVSWFARVDRQEGNEFLTPQSN